MAEAKKPTKAPAKPRKTAAKKTAEAPGPIAVNKADGQGAETKTKAPGTAAAHVSQEEIAKLAHHYWRERGGQHGSHEEDWLRAEQELRKRAS